MREKVQAWQRIMIITIALSKVPRRSVAQNKARGVGLAKSTAAKVTQQFQKT